MALGLVDVLPHPLGLGLDPLAERRPHYRKLEPKSTLKFILEYMGKKIRIRNF